MLTLSQRPQWCEYGTGDWRLSLAASLREFGQTSLAVVGSHPIRRGVSSGVLPESRAAPPNTPEIQHPIDSHAADRSRTAAESHCNESTCPEISLDPVGYFNLCRHISGNHGSEVAFYQGGHDQTAGARIVRAGRDPWLS